MNWPKPIFPNPGENIRLLHLSALRSGRLFMLGKTCDGAVPEYPLPGLSTTGSPRPTPQRDGTSRAAVQCITRPAAAVSFVQNAALRLGAACRHCQRNPRPHPACLGLLSFRAIGRSPALTAHRRWPERAGIVLSICGARIRQGPGIPGPCLLHHGKSRCRIRPPSSPWCWHACGLRAWRSCWPRPCSPSSPSCSRASSRRACAQPACAWSKLRC